MQYLDARICRVIWTNGFKLRPDEAKNKLTHPCTSVKSISGLVQMYSTVGERVPICRLRMLLNIWATSFFPCETSACRVGFFHLENQRDSLRNQHGTSSGWAALGDQSCTVLGTAEQPQCHSGVHYLKCHKACSLSAAGFYLHLLGPRCKTHSTNCFSLMAVTRSDVTITFSSFLSPFSKEVTASFNALTTSAGDFCDFPNKGILIIVNGLYLNRQEWKIL